MLTNDQISGVIGIERILKAVLYLTMLVLMTIGLTNAVPGFFLFIYSIFSFTNIMKNICIYW
jgi:hypothetical protein